ncbi:MAG TPA: leucyl aminopeptidase [Propionibacteriaceae bacterium]|nr:leucyl aminopeptidase [Propionibacteriaceae bacterium]
MPTPPLPSLTVARALPRNLDVLVVGYTGEGLREVPAAVGSAFSKRFGTLPAEMAETLGAKPGDNHFVTLPAAGNGPRIVVVGLESAQPTAEDLRRSAGAGVRHAADMAGSSQLSVAVALGTTDAAEAQAVAEGALLGSYGYTPISGKVNDRAGGIEAITVVHGARDKLDGVAGAAETVARAVVTAREWVNIPANLLYPGSFADQVRELVSRTRIGIDVLDENALARDGYGGLLAVGGGSSRPPRLVRLSYRPRGAKAHLALVGKGITFDTGGLNLKPAEGMYTMKCDMAGAAAVLAATWAIAQLGLKLNVTAYGALAENMPSSTAYRPSDVLTIYGGTTVENGNSDAEGRLVLADALARSAEDQPDLIVDVATLTGACVIALGERTVGVMSNDQDTADRVLDAAEAAGENLWPLPIPSEIRPKLDSKVADLRSTGTDRWGGALLAAAFLREFVPEGTPWVHLDIAGPAFHDKKPYGYVAAGGTGAGVRTLIALARSMAD